MSNDGDETKRRELLALLGSASALALAGCTGSDDDDGPDDGNGDGADDTDDDGDEQPETDDTDETTEEDDDDDEPEPAAFEIVDVGHPDEVEVGEEHEISITVENVGGEMGDFEEMLEISVAEDPNWEEVGLFGIGDVAPGDTKTESTDPFPVEEPATYQYRIMDTEWEYEAIRVVEEIDDQSFEGTGAEVRQDIQIKGGLTVIEATHDGERNFQVSLENGEFGEQFINVIGEFDGAQTNLVDEGEYILDVEADGNWEITLRQPRATEGESLPVTISGEGQRVYGPVEFEGTGVATADHGGESNFQVTILPIEDGFQENVFNEIGDFDGETSFSFDEVGWIDVNADGVWEVKFE